jgi:hypothetical protein
MKLSSFKIALATLALAAAAFAQDVVTVTAPLNNSYVDPTVQFVASAYSPYGVSGMTINVDSQNLYSTYSNKIDTLLTLPPGPHSVLVKAWDNKGNYFFTPLKITVWGQQQGYNFNSLQNTKWAQYSLLPPSYAICGWCSPNGPQLVLWHKQGVSNPSLSGSSMETYTTGNLPYSDGFWNNRLVGDGSPNPDYSHTLNPSLHHFTYDLWFYVQNPKVSQALEFDINQFVNGRSLIWGHECRLAGGYQWDIWSNPGQHWVPTGIPCNPIPNAWNHLIIEVERTSDNNLHYLSITLNGYKATTGKYDYSTATTWYGITVNYQQDGDYAQHAYSIWLDKVNFNAY